MHILVLQAAKKRLTRSSTLNSDASLGGLVEGMSSQELAAALCSQFSQDSEVAFTNKCIGVVGVDPAGEEELCGAPIPDTAQLCGLCQSMSY